MNASTDLTAAIVLLIVVGAVGVYGISVSSWPVLLGTAVIGAVALFLVPRNALPAAALWLLVLLPVGYIGLPALVGQFISPAVLVIAIWMVRLAFAEHMALLIRMPVRGWLIAAPFLLLVTASSAFSVRMDVSLAWMAVFIICVVAPALLGQISRDDVWSTVRWTLAGIGLFLGLLAAADFFIHFNPWTLLYERAAASHTGWLRDLSKTLGMMSVFRTRTSLGHPLNTAMVASVALAACVFPSRETRQWPYWICAAGALVALILSVSRTSVIAVGFSAIIGMLSALSLRGQSVKRWREWRGWLIAVLMAATFFAALALSPLLSRRNASEEGRGSALYRSQLLDAVKGLISEHPVLGFGPGASEKAYENHHLGLENSAFQLMVSIGLPAFLFVLVGLGVIVVVAMRRSRAGVAAGIVAFSISAIGYNVIDSSPQFLALIAPLVACAVMPGLGRSEQIESRPELADVTRAHPSRDDFLSPELKIKR